MDYKNGKIYVIRSYKTDKIYVGASCSPLYKRFYKHKQDYKRWLKTNKKYISSYEILKYGDAYIELYEKYPCSCKNELRKKEGETIRKLNCVNKRIEARTIEDIKQYHKKWFQDNKERTAEHRKKYRKEYEQTKKCKEYRRKYREENRELKRKKDRERSEKRKEYYEKNKDAINARRREKRKWKKKFNEVLKNIK